jgi:CheY-like chemotaxis protein
LSFDLDAMKIFYVDDDSDDREFFAEIVKDINENQDLKYSLELSIACDCYEAVDSLLKMNVPPDFVFLDFNMPKVNGFDCVKILKSYRQLKDVPIIICTTASTAEQRKKIIELDAQDLILKQETFAKMKTSVLNVFRKDYQLIC